jgi:hypothetical protein
MDADTYRQWWISHFCLRLIQLRGDMSVRAATDQAKANYAHAGDMEPAEAAEVFADRHPAAEAIAW